MVRGPGLWLRGPLSSALTNLTPLSTYPPIIASTLATSTPSASCWRAHAVAATIGWGSEGREGRGRVDCVRYLRLPINYCYCYYRVGVGGWGRVRVGHKRRMLVLRLR